MKKLLLSSVAFALAASSAFAQVNFVPQQGVTAGYYFKQTYSSAFYGLVPVTAGTDVVCIAASATKTVRLVEIKIYGTVATATQSLPVTLLRRAALDTLGTAASTTANPGTATQIASRDTGLALNTASSATLISYTANPTINDAAPVYLDSQLMFMPITTTGAAAFPVDFNYGLWNEDNIAPPTLAKGSTQQICVNINGVTLTNAAAWNGVITWSEE
jgi:hypothetical protein